MKTSLKTSFVLLSMALASHGATVILDSKNNVGLVTTASQATFGAQSFNLNVAGAGTNDTVAANLSAINSAGVGQITLNSITFVRAPSGTATVGSLFVKIYTGSADASGTPFAVSTNSIDVNGATALSDLTWTFGSPALSAATNYFAVFSTNGASNSTGTDGVGARIAAANFGGGFLSTVYGGSDTSLRGFNSLNPPVGTNLDARFLVNFDVVPEPSSALLGGLGAICLLRRRRA